MSKDTRSALLPIIGVIIGAILTFSAQFILSTQQEKSDIRQKTLDLKHEQCITLWRVFSDVYQYLYYSGGYSEDKIDMQGLGQHMKTMTVAIVSAEPFISHQGFVDLMAVRDTLNASVLEWQKGLPSTDDYQAFIRQLERPMNKARDVIRRELRLIELGVVEK